MTEFRNLLLAILLFVSPGAMAIAQPLPESVPDEPFKTVHLLGLTPAQEAPFRVAVSDFNHEFAKQGCPSCAYHVFKMAVGTDQKYNYMMTSDWPGRDVYIKIHTSTAFEAANKRNPVMSDLSETEFYGRYVEIK